MPGPRPLPIGLTATQRRLLERLARRPTTPQGLAQRAQILLHAATGANNAQIARRLGLHIDTVRLWRNRWETLEPGLAMREREGATASELTTALERGLRDAPRPGTPPTFTAEQVVQIVGLACETPEDSDRPISHWNARELAEEAMKRQIVPQISPRSVGRFLKRSGLTTPSQSLLAQSPSRRSGSV